MRLASFLAAALLSCSAPHLTPREPTVADRPTIAPDLAKIDDGTTWGILNAESSASAEEGRSVVRLFPRGGNTKGSNVGMALVAGLDFAQGAIEIDLRGKGAGEASFVGIAFHVADGKTYEAVYFRPFNFRSDDPTHRAHAVQYVGWPDHTWERLRKSAPGVYESAVDPTPDPARWFHVRIELAAKNVRVFVDDAKTPCLSVERLSGSERGGVGLWVDSQEGWFANLRIVRSR